MLPPSGLGDKLTLLSKWLSQFDFGCDHDFLLLLLSTKHANKCIPADFVTEKMRLEHDGTRTLDGGLASSQSKTPATAA